MLWRWLRFKAHEVGRPLVVTNVHGDFETGLIPSVSILRPEMPPEYDGCNFHFREAVIRWISANGLKGLYNNSGDPRFMTMVLRLLNLSFLNFADKPIEFDKLLYDNRDLIDVDDRIRDFIVYFTGSWTLDWQKMNVFNVDIRSNNHIEAFHRVLRSDLYNANNKPGSNLWRMLRVLQDKQKSFEVLALQMAAGNSGAITCLYLVIMFHLYMYSYFPSFRRKSTSTTVEEKP